MKFLLATHGAFASGLKSSIELLSGSCKQLHTIDAYLDEIGFETQLTAFLATCSADEPLIFLSDIYGGSVNQILYQHLNDLPDIKLICGVNLPLVMELVLQEEAGYSDEHLKQVIAMACEGIKLITKQKDASIHQEEDDFF